MCGRGCRSFLEAVSKVTNEDLKRVRVEYFSKLFNSNEVSCAVCCNTSKMEEIQQELER